MESKIWLEQQRLVQPVNGGQSEAVSGRNKESAQARKVAQEFEALFVGMMLKSMRETTGKDTLTGGGHGEDTYRSLLDDEYAKTIASHGGIGLAEAIERQLARQNDTRHEPRIGVGEGSTIPSREGSP